MKKKILSLTLCLVMVLTLLPTAAMSADVSNDDYEFVAATGALTVKTTNGTTAWRKDENIVGTGKADYSAVKSLTINSGVTYIEHSAFSGCKGLTGELTIPDSVTYIATSAFSSCAGLTGTLTIPDKVTIIGDYAFSGCKGLTGTLTIPNSVTSIGTSTISHCNAITEITVGSKNTKYFAQDGILYNKDQTTLIQCPGGKTGAVTIPNSVTTIVVSAFNGCTDLTSVTIPENVTTIGLEAFRDCSSLTSVTIPNGVTTIGSYAFYDCSQLASAEFQGSTPPTMGDSVFAKTASDFSITVPADAEAAYKVASSWANYQKYLPQPLSFADDAAYNIPASNVGTAITNIDVSGGVSGGKKPYTFGATGLPAGLSISSAGVISGVSTAEAEAGTDSITITVTDANEDTKTISISCGAVTKGALTGTVTITGTEKYDSTLTASASNSNSTGTLSYQWKWSGSDDVLGTASTYTLVEADIGKTITVTVTTSDQTGSLTSAATDPVGKADGLAVTGVAKSDCTTADNNDGKLSGVTEAMEYKLSTAEAWASGTGADITGLVPGTYSVRAKETATHSAGAFTDLMINGYTDQPHTHCICGGTTNVGDHQSHSQVSYQKLGPIISNSTTIPSGNYYLETDVTVPPASNGIAYIYLKPGSTVNLCLNGHKVNAAIVISAGSTLNLCDCTEQGSVSCVMSHPGGTFCLFGGTISGTYDVGVIAFAGSTVKLYGGTVTGCTSGGVVAMESDVHLAGNIRIQGNTTDNGATPCNLTVFKAAPDSGKTDASFLVLDGALTEQASIGVNIGTYQPGGASRGTEVSQLGVFTKTGAAGIQAADYAQNFKADFVDTFPDMKIRTEGNELKLTTDSAGSGSSGGSSDPTYSVTNATAKSENGSVCLSKAIAASGSTVKITPKANDGYAVDTLTVKDAKGNAISVTKNADGTYSFKMPSGKVTVEATFKAVAAAPAWVNPFTDVAEQDWYFGAVKFTNENGLFAGTDADSFSPNARMTRAMLWTVLGRLDGQALSGSGVFDAAKNWATDRGITDGSNPGGEITREQLVTILWRYAGSPKASGDLAQFSDANSVAVYAQEAMAWAVENGLVQGSAGKLMPAGNATRAQVAAILMRYDGSLQQ